MSNGPTPPPFPNVRPQPQWLELPYVAKVSSGPLRVSDVLGLVIGGVAVVNGLATGWIWFSVLGIVVMVVTAASWWRARANEPVTAFEVREDGLLADGVFQPFTSVVAARRTSSAVGFWSINRKSLWLEFEDGAHLAIGYWIANSAAIQAAVIEGLPAEVRARILADSRLLE